ncbi:BEL1-like homeodomain protein 3 [Hibiscus syriacus]|uniref:BEL1-like homeodomain protein 3 n=1 Tax=Hibiscus syriacus TaxID=106335 RepID=A0A6A2ZKA4_HIBSY|nr:BEL1-like homeodomain protein 1 [Hibiscus syriacus]XP_039014222.1 BEL1-like homeodomain protein 1 [Hibiscus syriacus]KAE8691739.1 BEL1-like homeodomain protein 3 [Hibiscus syriacus]
MATYFHGSSEFQTASAAPDGMQTLFLMNPNYVPYSDTHQPAAAPNMFFLNPTSLPQAPPPNNHQRFLGLPLPTPPSVSIRPVSSDDPHRSSPLHGVVPGFHSNLWGTSSLDHQNSPPRSTSYPQFVSAADNNNSGGSHDVTSSQTGFRLPVVSPRQGLSLSLSSHKAAYNRSSNYVETDIQGQQPQVPTMSLADDVRISGNSPSSVSVVSNWIPGAQSVVLGSKYLRAAQELLDEVVNVGKGLKTDVSEGTKEKIKMNKEPVAAVIGEGSSAAEDGTKRVAELTTAQRQELQMKKAKQISMLDEVEQRYKQYHHQMQIVVSSFEQAAGLGAAKSYTALALKTISKQFRCLKDAICGQIKATSKILGEEDCLGAKVEGSRLRYVDHQLRQQRALQQLGMVQHSAWRPQRGLPERAVSVLRAWLFEHFLHPYPKDSDKHMLAKQTGLTRSQVSNWFINARVRLWKPMVEEMYLEEVKEQEKNGSEPNPNETGQKEFGSTSNVRQENISFMMEQVKTQSQTQNSINVPPTDQFSNSISPMGGASYLPQTAFNLIGLSDLDGAAQRSPKKARGTVNDLQNSPSSILSMDMEMKQGDERLPKDSYSFPGGGFATYGDAMGDMGRFDPNQLTPRFHGNSVSLTLGLPHCENVSPSGNHHQNIQIGRRLELGTAESDFCSSNNAQQASHSTTFEMQNRKRFAEQLLPDFVA